DRRQFASRYARVCGAMSSESLEPQLSPVSAAGIVIRYAFFLVGAVVLSALGAGMLGGWQNQIQPVDDPPAFRNAPASVMQLPGSGRVVVSGRFGRAEIRQYGRLHDRDVPLSV